MVRLKAIYESMDRKRTYKQKDKQTTTTDKSTILGWNDEHANVSTNGFYVPGIVLNNVIQNANLSIVMLYVITQRRIASPLIRKSVGRLKPLRKTRYDLMYPL